MNDAPIPEPAFDDEAIPADIWAKAEAMIAESQAHPGIWSAKDTLARGMYIERERCATIAKGRAASEWPELGAEIADAIRKGSS